MSEFQTADEAVAALWDGLARELDELAPSRNAAHAFMEVARHQFLGMLRDFPHDVLTSVTAPARGTGKHRLVIGFSSAFKGNLALAAKRFHGISSD